MKYYLIAGEASGDLHGANLMKGLKKFDPDADFRFFGGDLMNREGGKLVCHFRKMAYMGLFDVLANLRTIAGNLSFCKKDILNFTPDVIILIDYPGFNLRIAKFAHEHGLKVFYYIAPKVWAWKKSRIKKLKTFVDKLFVIFPFEVEFFKQHDLHVWYFGNPLKDAIHEYRNKADIPDNELIKKDNNRRVIALLSGSRTSEIKHCLPEMVKAASYFPSFRFIVAGVPAIESKKYEAILSGTGISLVSNRTYKLLDHSYAAIVTSGTATLETALFNVPQVVIYKVGWLTYFLGKLFVKVRFFSLVNIISGKEVVKELLQSDIAGRIKNELSLLLNDEAYRKRILAEYGKISSSLGDVGVSERLAFKMIEILKS